jgi:zinc protease
MTSSTISLRAASASRASRGRMGATGAPVTAALILAALTTLAAGADGAWAQSTRPAGRRAAATASLAAPIPTDPAVRVGRLSNGLRYYLRRNARPEQRVELRLVVNAGSVLEDDDQRGLAHFTEHMLFNGTRRFKKNDIVSYLESIGVKFGADLNAYTGFDETVYILPVPTDKPGLLDRSFEILQDWASGALFDSVEVVSERGVVLEEWRGGLGADTRIRDQQFPVIFRGSRYAERLPIGLPEIIRNANPGPLRRFYRDWYRPDNMAVVAVGDVDVARLERLVRRHFSALRGPARPRPRPTIAVPGNDSALVTIATDPEEQAGSVTVMYKHPAKVQRTVADYRGALMGELYNFMLNQRLSEISRRPDAPFSFAGSDYGSLVRATEVYQLSAAAKEGGLLTALSAMLQEARRVDRHGFLPGELARARTALLRAYERAHAEREKTESASYVEEYVSHFLTGEPSPGIGWEYRQVQRLLPGITLDEVNALGRNWITERNRVVAISAPAADSARIPGEPAVLATFRAADTVTVAAWTETLAEAPLVADVPAPGRVVAESPIPELGVTQWTLSNGARVVLKPTDFKADEVLMRAFSPGGSSLVDDDDYPSALLATTIAERGGLGTFSLTDLGKTLTGKQARASAYLDSESEGISGGGSIKDLETIFQLTYLRFTAPRRDSSAYAAFRAQVAPFLANRANSPEAVFSDTVMLTMSQYHPRSRPLDQALLDRVSFSRAFDIYRDRFADASDFTFVFVGSFTLEQMRPLVERWLATLPSTGRKETWRDRGIRPPTGRIDKTVHKGMEPKASTLLLYSGNATFTPEARHALRSLGEYLEMRLLEILREALGGTYSVSVGAQVTRLPRPEYSVSIQFGSAPARADSLYGVILAVIDSTRAGAIAEGDVQKVREQQLRALEVNRKENNYWLTNLSARLENEEDPRGLLAYEGLIRGLTREQLHASARRYLEGANVARFVLLSERERQ